MYVVPRRKHDRWIGKRRETSINYVKCEKNQLILTQPSCGAALQRGSSGGVCGGIILFYFLPSPPSSPLLFDFINNYCTAIIIILCLFIMYINYHM